MEDLKTATKLLSSGSKTIGWRVDIAIPAVSLLKGLKRKRFSPMTMRLNVLRYDWLKPVGMPASNNSSRRLVAMNWSPVQFGMPHMSPQSMGFVVLKGSNSQDGKAKYNQRGAGYSGCSVAGNLSVGL
jgi:hypothetical protein